MHRSATRCALSEQGLRLRAHSAICGGTRHVRRCRAVHTCAQASVCIGSTSARACEAAGLTKVYFPEAPGIEGWVRCVEQAARDLGLAQAEAATAAAAGR